MFYLLTLLQCSLFQYLLFQYGPIYSRNIPNSTCSLKSWGESISIFHLFVWKNMSHVWSLYAYFLAITQFPPQTLLWELGESLTSLLLHCVSWSPQNSQKDTFKGKLDYNTALLVSEVSIKPRFNCQMSVLPTIWSKAPAPSLCASSSGLSLPQKCHVYSHITACAIDGPLDLCFFPPLFIGICAYSAPP